MIIATVSSPEETTPNPTTPDTASDRASIGFLLNCPRETDFIEEFPKSTNSSPNPRPGNFSNLTSTPGRSFQPMDGVANGPLAYRDYGHIQETNLDVFLSHLEFSNFEQQTNNWQTPNENLIPWSGSDALFLDRTILGQKAFEIKSSLKRASELMNPPHRPPAEILDALELIVADNIAAWIKLYFKHWHKHAPMVHEATFNPCNAAVPLVLSLMSLGAMVIVPNVSIIFAG